ncbi:putative distant relative of homeotic protein bithoraxoid [Methanocella conradii HZ254]|uniref:Distant relative of homeotic protein bithoraxoid n=1 Tax=Methanocella conradii (strain DSM 24694 / JCM 17849 / CGMCC 1.5162 / HZ254) TaxID=1041930 RepID=H8I6I9_METCZ|nr:roadblock/LC7 domain-containing protein [Methanocella conradii]AFC98881.1 putative distant relative of homeotic protein bithoraxoid [Methanocella conradii HZ254]MDI6897215.1 roadblock/LC7 domain-containing protein [Methanocella conradii]
MLKRILGDLAKVEGVNAAAIVGRDGFIIEHVANIQVDMDALGAMASTSVGTSEAMGIELGKGNFEQVLVELEKGPIMLSLISQNEILAIVAEHGANIGRIRYEVKKNKDRLAAAL